MNADTHKFRSLVVCLAAAIQGLFLCPSSWAQRIDPETYQRVVDENIELRQEQGRLAKENAELRRKNADLILDAQGLETKRDQMAALVSRLSTPEETREELARLQAERSSLGAEVGRLRQALLLATSVSTNLLEPPPGPEPGSSLFRKIEQENAELRQQIERDRATSQTDAKAHEALLSQLSEQKALQARQREDLEALTRQKTQLEAREAALKKALAKLAHKAFQQQEELGRLKADRGRTEITGKKQEETKPFLSPAGTTPVAPAQVSRDAASLPEGIRPAEADPFASARQALKLGKARDAEKIYLQVLKNTPKDPRVHYNLGILYSDYLKNPDKAAYHFHKYLDLSPTAPDADKVRSWLVELDMRAER
jgi:hypothetical protein